MRIYLVRHAQSEWQTGGTADLDSPLTPLGSRQSALLGRWLAEHDRLDAQGRLEVGELYTSPFRRARETAEPAAAALKLPLLVRPDLCEAEFRVADQLPRWTAPLVPPSEFALPAAYVTFQASTKAALRDLVSRAQAAAGPIMVFTHGGIIKTMVRLLAATEVIDLRLYNAGVSCIEWDGARWRLVHLNLWDHLPPELRTV
jgi:broad specificity phosphatase PhoE